MRPGPCPKCDNSLTVESFYSNYYSCTNCGNSFDSKVYLEYSNEPWNSNPYGPQPVRYFGSGLFTTTHPFTGRVIENEAKNGYYPERYKDLVYFMPVITSGSLTICNT